MDVPFGERGMEEKSDLCDQALSFLCLPLSQPESFAFFYFPPMDCVSSLLCKSVGGEREGEEKSG